ncbi:S24 family peptidase [Pseudomonas sp. NC26]|uniref:Translesion error-prone DNA polymerase V autoproteolytic subunit n=1 Tax=Pseudomonas putida TaxID=303 RepID=A0A7W2L6X5_PSEPU|nr:MULTISPECIES: S24 family peptidase [Pseudomonas]MBA6119437.1 translesion error-prone DNA polymerase V autoproteolytic subunit [Pseudomonas putida]MCZ9636909.1 S24 family peptidase [Pseudomonas putida]MEC4876329.1 S24 family peptidase [Pseudomonas sp. NC26]QNL88856.1 Error-prone repair protein UmuD [Pseudomonas putida]
MTITFVGAPTGGHTQLPVYASRVPAGFPSPAADHLERHISLDELFDLRAPHVYLVQVEGDSMQGAGIYSGDLLIVDRSREAEHGDIVIAAINAEPVCKRLYRRDGVVILQSENPAYPPRHVLEVDDLLIWGVVRYSVRDHAQ